MDNHGKVVFVGMLLLVFRLRLLVAEIEFCEMKMWEKQRKKKLLLD